MTQKLRVFLASFVYCLAFLATHPVKAEDIDLFVGNVKVGDETVTPNVLIIVDNTANWNTAFVAEMTALENLFDDTLQDENVRVGIMMFTETGRGNSNTDGGYVRAAVRELNPAGLDSLTDEYSALIDSFDRIDDASNGGKAGLTMMETYNYFSSGTPHGGTGKKKTDFKGNSGINAASDAIYAIDDMLYDGHALSSFNGTTYSFPDGDTCAGNHIIYITNGPAQDNASDTRVARDALEDAGGDTTTISISPSGSMDNMSDEWARFLYEDSGMFVHTHVIEIDPVTTGQNDDWTALVKSMAHEGNGEYIAVDSNGGGDSSEIDDALKKIFTQILADNTAFAAVTLPVSSQSQDFYLNQVYIGMFRPDADKLPRWYGNLKRYEFDFTDSNENAIHLVDQDGEAALGISGFLAPCARSYWTPDFNYADGDDYWAFDASGACLEGDTDAVNNAMKGADSPDGHIVEKGAQSYQLRQMTPAERNIQTCSDSTCSTTTLVDLASGALGLSDDEINWVRGMNIKQEGGKSNTEMRPSAHTGVIHSRPVAVNFGTIADPEVVIFYGSDEGLFKAVDTATGEEEWAFFAPEFAQAYAPSDPDDGTASKVTRLMENAEEEGEANETKRAAQKVKFVGDTEGNPKSYGMDGPVGIQYIYNDSNALTEARLFVPMRRGGNGLYAFKVTKPSGALTFELMWRKELGTGAWSAPKIVTVLDSSNAQEDVLLVDSGYDLCEDDDNDLDSGEGRCTGSRSDTTVLVLDPATGAEKRAFTYDNGDDIKAGTPGGFGIDYNALGLADHIYFTDLSGHLYRIKTHTKDSNGDIVTGVDDWEFDTIAYLGCDGDQGDATATKSCDRKLMFTPDVVTDSDDSSINYIMIGAGDREKPVDAFEHAMEVSNYFFMIVDDTDDSEWFDTVDHVVGGSDLGLCAVDSGVCPAALPTAPISYDSDEPLDWDLDGNGTVTADELAVGFRGWKLELAPTEQVVTSSVTGYGEVTFSTSMPPPEGTTACQLNVAYVYNVNYLDASPTGGGSRSDLIAGGGLPPNPVMGVVQIGDKDIPFKIGSVGSSPLEGEILTPPGLGKIPLRRGAWEIRR